MAIDYIIGGLMLSSAAVNVLALGAFWISPGLRTTANRFVINLLVVNVVACIALVPVFWQNGRFGGKPHTSYDDENDFGLFASAASNARLVIEEPQFNLNVEPLHSRYGHHLPHSHHIDAATIEEKIVEKEITRDKLLESIQSIESAIIERETGVVRTHKTDGTHCDCHRFWGFDLAATLGGLSVVLVVGDTWCAVTDPLRYHSRISYAKSWLLIGAVWVTGLIVAFASAFRSDCCFIGMDVLAGAIGDVADVYNWIFSSLFFVLIIFLPICLVCIMYWNIFTEARQSGQRMRRNGSSPLLQSALNLAHPNGHRGSFGEPNRCPSVLDIDALTMKIDGIKETPRIGCGGGDFTRHSVKATVPIGTHQYRRYLDIPKAVTDGETQPDGKTTKASKSKRDLRHSTAPLEAAHGVCRMISGEMRLVHSTPNLQKFANAELLHRVDYCTNNRSTSNIHSHQQQQQTGASPKALSYMVSIRHRLSNASSIFKYREESRAARISILVVVMLLVSYFPYGMLVLLHGRVIFLANSSLFSILFLLIGSMSSPFIFAYRNRRVRRGVCRLFGVDAKPNSYLQKQRMQLRNGIHATGTNSKHVRIHRNLSASNISLNLLPCKFSAAAMLPLHHQYAVHEQLRGITECGDATNPLGNHFGQINDAKIDENDEQFSDSEKANEPKSANDSCDGVGDDINNNISGTNTKEAPITMSDAKKSFFKRVLSRRLSASATPTNAPPATESAGCENEPVDV